VGVHEHKKAAPRSVGCAVVTVSDSRDAASDTSGATVRSALEAAGHRILDYRIVPDETTDLLAALATLIDSEAIDAVVTNGGTGISPRDNTYEAVAGLLTRRLDGFGELFRLLSFEEVGSSAMLSRAVGGVAGTTVVFALPGSTAACRLAMERLIIPEIGHLVSLANPEKWRRAGAG
jgi:molybdenum cofactor biosynthesis protein B